MFDALDVEIVERTKLCLHTVFNSSGKDVTFRLNYGSDPKGYTALPQRTSSQPIAKRWEPVCLHTPLLTRPLHAEP